MEFFCYHRDRADSQALRDELLEDHWSYMDGYAKEMIARGPTFSGPGEDDVATGSVHIVDLPHARAARAFAFDEPGYQAGVYRDVMLRRWRNLLGRTMWDFPGGRTGGTRYLVLGLGEGREAGTGTFELPDPVPPTEHDELIAYGPLLSDDGRTWLGTATLVRAPDPDAARAVLTADRHAADRYAEVEVHLWQFGGRQ
ncbi:YciI family protein [Streptomyces sp. NPDC005529]|uniref:YciI family protein n=1 Tax=unclassified Streptomyces TaxID=2593676 RepID=UPI00339E588F